MNLLNQSLWLDEATTALVAKMELSEIFSRFLPGDFHPPLYYVIMKYWVLLFGNSEISLRVPSFIFAVLTVYLVYKMFGRVAAILLATAPLLFYYSHEARMYTMTMFCVTLAFFSLMKINNKSRVGWWVLFSLALFLIAATDYLALLILPVLWYMGRRYQKELFVSHIILGAFWLWWLPYFLSQLKTGLSVVSDSPAWSQLLGYATFKNIFLIPVKFMIGRVSFEINLMYALVVGIISVLFITLLVKGKKEPKNVWLWFEIPLLLGILTSIKIPVLNYFRFLFVLPAFYILLAKGIGKSRLFFCLVLMVNLLSIMYYVLTPRFHREDWRAASVAIGKDQIILPSDSQKEALIYYGKGNQIVAEPTAENVWLSRYVWEIFDPDDLTKKKVEDLGYNMVSEHNFNGVVFWKYAHRN